jgi:hypothetical protein
MATTVSKRVRIEREFIGNSNTARELRSTGFAFKRSIGAHLPLQVDIDGTLAIAEAPPPHARRLVVTAGVSEFEQMWARRAMETASVSCLVR